MPAVRHAHKAHRGRRPRDLFLPLLPEEKTPPVPLVLNGHGPRSGRIGAVARPSPPKLNPGRFSAIVRALPLGAPVAQYG